MNSRIYIYLQNENHFIIHVFFMISLSNTYSNFDKYKFKYIVT